MELRQPSEKTPVTGKKRSRRLARLALAAALGWVALTIVLVLPWRWIPPPTTAFMLRERILGEGAGSLSVGVVGRHFVPPTHRGRGCRGSEVPRDTSVSISRRSADAMERNRRGGRVRGGSTISQQVAKNLYLWPGQNLVRKAMEAYFTLAVELMWPKRRILEVYLNVAEFGPGIFGVSAASRHAFDREPGELTPREAATLIAVLPSPRRMSAARPSEYVIRPHPRDRGGW